MVLFEPELGSDQLHEVLGGSNPFEFIVRCEEESLKLIMYGCRGCGDGARLPLCVEGVFVMV